MSFNDTLVWSPHDTKKLGATHTPSACAFIKDLELIEFMAMADNVPNINVSSFCVGSGSDVNKLKKKKQKQHVTFRIVWRFLSKYSTYSWINWPRSSGSQVSFEIRNNSFSISSPKILPGILLKNFFNTDATVYTE